MRRALPAVFLLAALLPLSQLKAQHFTPGNLAVLLVTDGTSKGTTGSIVELATTATSAQSPVTNPGVNGLFFSGNATSTGYLANSNDGTLLCVTGATATASNVNTVTTRGVVTLDVNQVNNLAASYTGLSGNQTRCATTIDNTNYFIADQGGLYTNNATTPSNTSNFREIKSFGGAIYASASSVINTVSGSTLTPLPNVGTITNLTGFYLIQSGSNGTTYDILYAITASKETAGTIAKYSFDPVSGSWTANGAYITTFGGYSIAAKTVGAGTGSTAELYVSTGEGDLVSNSVLKCIDQSGWNQTINIPATAPTILYTATGNNSVKGIAFAPIGTVTTTPPTVSLSVSTNTASEAAQTQVTITATTSAAVTTAQTVTLQVTGEDNITSDYTLSGNTITIPAGQTTGTATFTVVDDHITEGLEQDVIAISAVSSGLTIGAPSSQPVNIQDNDPSPTLMRITEYMYSGNNGEFVEFTNVGSTPIDMTGWSYDDNGHTPGKVSLSVYGIVQPGESVILTETDAATFRTDWSLCSGQPVIGGNTDNLGRSDQINLYDNNNILVDRLTYGDQTFPGTIRTQDVSGYVTAAALGLDNIAGWTLSSIGDAEGSVKSTGGDIGSPGRSTQATVPYNPCATVTNAPTIAIDSVNTALSLLGPGKPSPASPFAISGTINDPNDPAAIQGLYFTIQSTDPSVPTGNITVTATSSNTAVVPQSGISFTGGVASYLLKIIPAGVGYSNITLTATNPNGSITTTYTILYAASQSASTSLVWHTGSSDASDAIGLSDTYMAIGDDQINKIFIYSRTNPGQPDTTFDYTANNALNLPDGTPGNYKQIDVEAATPSPTVSGLDYFFGSMSNSSTSFETEANRDRMFAVKITGSVEGKNIAFSSAGYSYIRSQLIAWGDANGYDFTDASASGQNPKTIDGFNIEGAVFAPDNTTLYFGFRAPLVPTANRTMAVIAPVLNFESWFQSGGTATANFGSPIQLDLGGRGIRDMIRLSNGTYVIAAGSYDGTLNPAIYTWTGNATDPAVAQPGFDLTGLNTEGLIGINNADGTLSLNQLQVITDNGSDVLYGDGTEAKDLTELNWQKFSTSVVTSPVGTPLPAVFISFTAQRESTNADLNWTTGIPGSLTSFSVQRSTDGATFTTNATVTAAIDTQTSYSYIDQNAPATKVYYRIQANERSGQTVLSTIRALDAGNSAASIQVYPNPVVNGTFTVIIPNTGLKTVSIYNSTGVLIEQTAFGDTAKDFSTAGWAKGFYLLRIILADGSTTTTKLIIP